MCGVQQNFEPHQYNTSKAREPELQTCASCFSHNVGHIHQLFQMRVTALLCTNYKNTVENIRVFFVVDVLKYLGPYRVFSLQR